jgi:hypothetical protein
MAQQTQLVIFHLRCPEQRAWLVLASDSRKSRVLEMHQLYPCNWLATAYLIPGQYDCRYYGGDDRTVIYYGAAKIEARTDCGIDALVSVNSPQEKRMPRFSQPETQLERGGYRLSETTNRIQSYL